ncbi:hypothetical protein H4217_002427 [Coemansia sp. RSA 1939]|nr:hypothetical protein H4217_002427 [Coemansia sp. RSA 1939]KAJ2602902.1 hypothetical protein EV177_006753 [Coemansia sp. RSA 1804]
MNQNTVQQENGDDMTANPMASQQTHVQYPNRPPDVLPGQQIPELNTLNPPMNHWMRILPENMGLRISGHRALNAANHQSGFSSPEGQQFYNEDGEGDENDALGLGGHYDGNDDTEESANDYSNDGADGENDDYSDSFHTPTQPYSWMHGTTAGETPVHLGRNGVQGPLRRDPLTINDDALGGSRHDTGSTGFHVDGVDEFISINTQLSPRIHRRMRTPRIIDSTVSGSASRSPISAESSTAATTAPAASSVTSAAAEKRRHSRRESDADRPQAGASATHKRLRQSRLSGIAEISRVEAGTSVSSTLAGAGSATGASSAAIQGGPGGSHGQRSRIMFKCAVCLDIPDPAVFAHPCGHVFCEGCVQSAAQVTRRCPVCRHSLRPRDIRVLQFRVAKVGRAKTKT